MKVQLILCDSAQIAETKLFLLGGGWDTTYEGPSRLCVAGIIIAGPEDRGEHPIRWRLVRTDTNTEALAGSETVATEELLVVSEEPPAWPVNIPFAINWIGVPLTVGDYDVEVDVDRRLLGSCRFHVKALPADSSE